MFLLEKVIVTGDDTNFICKQKNSKNCYLNYLFNICLTDNIARVYYDALVYVVVMFFVQGNLNFITIVYRLLSVCL